MKPKRFFLLLVVMAVAFSALVALLLFSQSTKAYAQATIPPPPELGEFRVEPTDGVVLVQNDEEPILVTIVFTDPTVLDLTFIWTWGDGTTTTCPPESPKCSIDYGDGISGEIFGTHAYQEPGVYSLQLNVLDKYGQFDTATSEYIVAYDPSGGFVTGGGWIDSPEGAYKPDPSLTGKANFGFVSKYKKGADVPTGNTEFQFHAADINFHSSSYEWLVVTGSDYARFKGVGTINGEGEYKFMLWAGDGTGTDGTDTFRIKIWWEEGDIEHVVYDNGMDQYIAGGSIVVHTKK